MKPGCGFGHERNSGKLGGRLGRNEVAEQAGLLEPRLAVLGDLDGEEPLVHDLPESIDDARPVEVDARGRFVLEGVERGALTEVIQRARVRVPTHGFEERDGRA